MKPVQTIILTGGGSGGHITPLLPLARALKKNQPKLRLVYIGHKGDKVDSSVDFGSAFDETYKINGGKFRRYHGESLAAHLLDVKTLSLNLRDFFRVIGATFTCLGLLKKARPVAVFSKGGFVAVPVCLAARIKKIPIITHDSDAVPGLANRIVGRWAAVHATGMPAELYSYPPKTTFYVGIPMSDKLNRVGAQQLGKYKQRLGLRESEMAILVAGGGNGSARLNELIVAASPKLLSDFPQLNIFHLTGSKHLQDVRQAYKASLPKQQLTRVKIFDFVDSLYGYSGAADLIITRAGASSLAEFSAQAKACIVIPSPFLAAGHQLKNAEILKRQNAAVVLDNSVSNEQFQTAVEDLIKDPGRRAELGNNLSSIAKPEAADRLARIILSVAAGEIVGNAP